MNFRFSHVRQPNVGSVISDGQVTYKLVELIKADPFGVGGSVDVGDFIDAGIVELKPVLPE